MEPKQRNAWLQLLRPPNLFTVPGDPLMGWLAASIAMADHAPIDAWRVVLVATASLLLYAGGLIQNDYFDLEEDRVQRPDRPLPSGRVRPVTAFAVAMVLALLGVAAAFFASSGSGAAAVAVFFVMTVYNMGAKRKAGVGPILMGACRGLSLLIGAGLLGRAGQRAPAVVLCTVGLTAMIAAVTLIAAGEMQIRRIGWWRWVPAVIVALWLGALLKMLPLPAGQAWWMTTGLAAWAVVWLAYCGGRLRGQPPPATVQRTIGLYIGGLMFVQAAVAVHALPQGGFVAAALLLGWTVSRRIGKWFYAS